MFFSVLVVAERLIADLDIITGRWHYHHLSYHHQRIQISIEVFRDFRHGAARRLHRSVSTKTFLWDLRHSLGRHAQNSHQTGACVLTQNEYDLLLFGVPFLSKVGKHHGNPDLTCCHSKVQSGTTAEPFPGILQECRLFLTLVI